MWKRGFCGKEQVFWCFLRRKQDRSSTVASVEMQFCLAAKDGRSIECKQENFINRTPFQYQWCCKWHPSMDPWFLGTRDYSICLNGCAENQQAETWFWQQNTKTKYRIVKQFLDTNGIVIRKKTHGLKLPQKYIKEKQKLSFSQLARFFKGRTGAKSS